MTRTLVWLARHGSTTDSDKNIFRGQRDSALDKQGFKDAHELHDFFADKKWSRIFHSPLTRALQTAIVLAGDRESDIMPAVRGLLPWNIGYLTGKDKTKYGPDMQAFIDNPDMAIQDGESRNDFEKGRSHPLLIQAMEFGTKEDPPIIIGHSSIVHSLNHLINGENHKDLAVKPGGVVEIYEDKDEIKMRAALKSGHDDSSFATQPSTS